jgi:hypothetical protein
VPVVADAAVSVESVGGGDRCGYLSAEDKSGTGEKDAVQKIAPRDRLVHAETLTLSSIVQAYYAGRQQPLEQGRAFSTVTAEGLGKYANANTGISVLHD